MRGLFMLTLTAVLGLLAVVRPLPAVSWWRGNTHTHTLWSDGDAAPEFAADAYKTRAGMSKGQLIGEVGIVTRDIRPYDRGQIRLQKTVLGEELWESIAEEEIKAGERVRVLEVEGNFLKVGRS